MAIDNKKRTKLFKVAVDHDKILQGLETSKDDGEETVKEKPCNHRFKKLKRKMKKNV
jgi:hypothetical protein